MTSFSSQTGRTQIIAEVAQAHDGSLGSAHAFIDVAARAGADAIKFQTHIVAAESTPHEPWRVKFSRQDATRYDYWKRMEFPESAWKELRAHAHERGLSFLSSAFSLEAVQLLRRVGVDAWKIASGETRSYELLDAMAESRLPVLLSTGMSPWKEIDAAVKAVQAHDLPLTVMQCTSMYPTPPESVGLNVLHEMRSRYGTPVGLSDHSGTIWPGVAAAAMGAEVVEVHIALSKQAFGPDVSASLDPDGLGRLVEGVRFLNDINDSPVDKDAMADELSGLRQLFMKSVVVRRPLSAGHVLKAADLIAKKPGSGIPAGQLQALVGRRVVHDLPVDHLIRGEDLDPVWDGI